MQVQSFRRTEFTAKVPHYSKNNSEKSTPVKKRMPPKAGGGSLLLPDGIEMMTVAGKFEPGQRKVAFNGRFALYI